MASGNAGSHGETQQNMYRSTQKYVHAITLKTTLLKFKNEEEHRLSDNRDDSSCPVTET